MSNAPVSIYVLSIARLSPVPFFQMNYFVSHATTDIFVNSAGTPPASASLIIGAPNLSAILIAIIHCIFVSKDQSVPVHDVGFLRSHFALSAIAAIAGNVVHALAVNTGSVHMAMLGRFIFGFSSSEILHRQLVAACRPSQVVVQAARLVHFRVFGIISGLVLGCLAEAVPFTITSLGIRAMQSTSWIMAFLWLMHLVRILVQLRKPNGVVDDHLKSHEDADEGDIVTPVESEDREYDSSESDPMSTPKSVLYRSSSPITAKFVEAYGGAGGSGIGVPRKNENRKSACRQLKSSINRFRMLLGYHVGIPIALFITVYVNYAFEAFFTGELHMIHVSCLFFTGLCLSDNARRIFTHRNASYDESIFPMERGSGGWLSWIACSGHPSNPLLLRVHFTTIRRAHSSQGKFSFRLLFTLHAGVNFNGTTHLLWDYLLFDSAHWVSS